MFACWHVNMTVQSIYAGVVPPEFKHYTERELFALPLNLLKQIFQSGSSFWHKYQKHHADLEHTIDQQQQDIFDQACNHTPKTDAQLLKADRETLLPKQLERRDVLERQGEVKEGQIITHRNRAKDKEQLKELRRLAQQVRLRLPDELTTCFDFTNATIAVLDRIAFIIRAEKRNQISISELANRLPCSKATVKRALKALRENMIIVTTTEKIRNKVNDINKIRIIRYAAELLHLKAQDNDDSFFAGGRLKSEPDSRVKYSSFNTLNTDCSKSKGERAHRGKAPALSSLNENSPSDQISDDKEKCSQSSSEDRNGNFDPAQMFKDPAKNKGLLETARSACKFLDPEMDKPRTWKDVLSRAFTIWETHIPNLSNRNWHMTGTYRGEKLRALILIETAMMQKIGAIHKSAPGFFVGIAKKPKHEIMPHVTISRILEKRFTPKEFR